MFTAFDIETGPLPADVLAKLIDPFPPFQPPGPFDPALVKYGNTKDPAKRAEKLEQAKANHAEDCLKAGEKYEAAKIDYEKKVVENAALDARHGRILAIGFQNEESFWCESGGDENNEAKILREFWSSFDVALVTKAKVVGHNIFGFDLPFIIQRSWINGIVPSPGVLDKGKWWSDVLVDTMARWQAGNHRSQFCSLDSLARVLRVGAKNGDGKYFHQMWAEDRTKAIEYLRNDLDMTYRVALKLGVR